MPYRQLSLLEQERLTRPGASDAEHVTALAADTVRELALVPPIDPHVIASYLDIAEIEASDLDVAGCLLCLEERLQIRIRRHDSAERQRFTIFHECTHTFFPGFARQAQYRCNPTAPEAGDPGIEGLCDQGASEFLLPEAFFSADVASADFGLDTIIQLAGDYEASIEATGHRFVDLSPEDALFVVLEMGTKPRDKRGAPARLRVRTARGSGEWPFVPRFKSVSELHVLDRALKGEVIDETVTLDEICAPMEGIHVTARLVPYGSPSRTRVLALARKSSQGSGGAR